MTKTSMTEIMLSARDRLNVSNTAGQKAMMLKVCKSTKPKLNKNNNYDSFAVTLTQHQSITVMNSQTVCNENSDQMQYSC